MKSTFALAAAVCLMASIPALGQGRGGAPAAPPVETIAPGIPGVVAAGTRGQIVKTGFAGTEGPIALPDGGVIFTETPANRITKSTRTTTSPRSSKTPTDRMHWRLTRRGV